MEIILDTPREIEIIPARKITTDKILVNQFTDTGTSVSAIISIGENTKTLSLWEGEEYINAGQYTDTDVINRIKQLI